MRWRRGKDARLPDPAQSSASVDAHGTSSGVPHGRRRARDLTPEEVGTPPVEVQPKLPSTFNPKAKGPLNWSGSTDGSSSSAGNGGDG